MIVVSLSNCPPSLRGDLTKWMFEVSTNVFVGRMTARVRDELWERIIKNCKNGRAVMVLGANNEQHFEFRVHNAEWKPMDYDGLKLMMRPNSPIDSNLAAGYSKASKFRKARYRKKVNEDSHEDDGRVFVDIVTTGPSPDKDSISSIRAAVIEKGEAIESYSVTVDSHFPLITGENTIQASDQTRDQSRMLSDFIDFVDGRTIVMYGAGRNKEFIYSAGRKLSIFISELIIEDMQYAFKKQLYNLKNHNL